MISASDEKLFTTAAALSIMESDFHSSTKLLTGDLVQACGVITGNLYIKEYGNSLFTGDDLSLFDNMNSEFYRRLRRLNN